MKKLTILSLVLTLVLYHGVQAQSDSVYTLDRCIDYAFKNQANVKNAVLDQTIAQQKVNETRGYGLPQIGFEATSMYNVALRPMFMTAERGYGFQGQPVPPGVDPNSVIAIPNVFQLKASNEANLNATQLIFDGSYIVALQASKTYTELATKSVTQTKIETVDKITKGFYLVLINEHRVALLESNLTRLDTSLKQLRIVYENGLAESLELNRLEVAYNNLATDLVNVQNQIIVTYSLLKYQMGYPVDVPLKLNGDLNELVERLNTVYNPETGDDVYDKRIEYSLMQTQKRLSELNFKNSKAISYPRLVAFGNAGLVNSQSDYGKLYSTSYYGFGHVGVRLSVPLFTGLNHYYQQQQAKIEVQKIENNLLMMEDVIDLQIQQTNLVLRNNIANIKSQRRNLDLADQVIKITKIKYDEGVGTNLEMVDAENSFKTAQTNYYNAVYDALISLIDYQKATGTLYGE
jgi:outer membrane protein